MQKILLVDKIDTVSQAYFDLLSANYKVEASIDAGEIVQRAKRFRPDVMIVNSSLPDFDAEEICSVVADELNTPIILLVDPNTVITMNIDSCKADEIITKPFMKEALLQTIARLLAFRD